MISISLQPTPSDFRRASEFVISHLKKLGHAPTSLKPLVWIIGMIYAGALFTIVEAPNYQDDHTRLLVRASVLVLMTAPFLFLFGMFRLGAADRKAIARLAPQRPEPIQFTASASGLELRMSAMTIQLCWSAVSIFVLDSEFAVLFVPRLAPFPIMPSESSPKETVLQFLSCAQQYMADSASNAPSPS